MESTSREQLENSSYKWLYLPPFTVDMLFRPQHSFPDTFMVATLLDKEHLTILSGNEPNLGNCNRRHWAARGCGQLTENTIESAPETTHIMKKFPFC